MRPIHKMSVFDLKLHDRILNSETKLTGQVVSIDETSYEYIEALVTWSDKSQSRLNMYDKNLYLIND